MKRISTLVDITYEKDPRVAKFKEEDRKEKEQLKEQRRIEKLQREKERRNREAEEIRQMELQWKARQQEEIMVRMNILVARKIIEQLLEFSGVQH